MEILEAIYGRRAVRDYTAEAVDRAALEKLIAAAVQAPSALNEQPWLFCVVQDRTVLARISQAAKAHMLATCAPGSLPERLLTKLSDPASDLFYGAPALVVIASATASARAVENCALAAQNLMLAAHASGLGTCWIGLAQAWFETPEGKAFLGLSPTARPVAPIIVGHPAKAPPPVARNEPQIRWLSA